MSLWDGIKRQLRSVIEWEHPSDSVLFYRWSENGDEIKNASKLIVGPGQGCIFVYEGKVVSITTQEAMVSLLTENIPFWTTITKFMQAFESEHKVGIYFFRTAMLLDQKWGTSSSIKYEDPKYGFPVGLRAYGNYSYKITNPEHFFVSVVGAQDIFTSDEFREIMTSRIVHPLTDYLAEEKLSYIDIDAKREEISIALLDRLNKEFIQLGFHLNDFRIEGTGFDEGTKERISRIADIAADSHAAKAAGVSYQELQKLQAMREAANNEVGAAGVFMGLGAGNMLSQTMNESITSQQVDSNDFTLKLRQLKSLFEEGLINEEEYSAKKADILKEL